MHVRNLELCSCSPVCYDSFRSCCFNPLAHLDASSLDVQLPLPRDASATHLVKAVKDALELRTLCASVGLIL